MKNVPHGPENIIKGIVLRLVLLGSLSFSQAQDIETPVVTVIHVDAMPQFTKSVASLLFDFRKDSLGEAGAEKFAVLQQLDHPNHFTLVEQWRSEKEYEAHNISEQTRHFRDLLQPMLGSPFDERLHTELITAP